MVLVSIVQVDVPELEGDTVTDAGLNDVPGPDGEIVSVSATVPENPFRPTTVMIMDESEAPARTVRLVWLVEIAKPAGGVTVKTSEVEFLMEPLTPLIVTV